MHVLHSLTHIVHIFCLCSAAQVLLEGKTDRHAHTHTQTQALCLFCASVLCIQIENLGVQTESISKTTLQIPNKSRGLGCDGGDLGGLERIAGRGDMGR